MKKYYLLITMLCFVVISTQAQKKKTTENAAPANVSTMNEEPELQVYDRAVKYGDYETAKQSMYMMLQKHPDKKQYLDSLVHIYFTLAQYPQCILSGLDFLQGPDTGNTSIMELVAVSYGSINRYKESLDIWEKLWLKTGKDEYAYQLAISQYLLKRYLECSQTIDIIIKDPASAKLMVNVAHGQSGSQKVEMKAAAYNMLGVIQKELSMNDQAKSSFEAAVKISPDFELAKNNLEQMNAKADPKAEVKEKEVKKK